MKKVLIGTCKIDKDVKMENRQFGYAASYEDLIVEKGEYPIYAYADDLEKDKDGNISLGWRNFIGFEGKVITSNVGGRPGEATSYHQMNYDYLLAEDFLNGHEYINLVRRDYILRPEWKLKVRDFTYDNVRNFILKIALKDKGTLQYMD